MSVLVPTLILSVEHFFHRSDLALGIFFAVTALSGAIGAMGCGLATERLGRKITTPIVTALLGIGLVCQSLAPSWTLFFLAAVMANIGAGALDGDINGLFLDMHSGGSTGQALNLLHFYFSVGSMAGAFIIGQFIKWGSLWQSAIGTTGILITVLALVSLTLPLPSGKRVPSPEKSDGVISGRERSLIPFFGLAAAICLYVGAELGVTSWVVRYVAERSLSASTGALAVFWGGITVGRAVASRYADRFSPLPLTVWCFVVSTATLIAAVVTTHIALALALYGLTGLFFGPIFPMIMVIGGKLYPHRLSLLSGSLSAAATIGAVVYPGLMGYLSVRVGIRFGMLGAAALGLAAAAVLGAVALVTSSAKSPRTANEP